LLDFVSKRFWYFVLSLLIIVPGTISLFTFGVKRGIEFTSGSTMTLRFVQPVPESDLREELTRLGHGDAIIQRTAEGDFFVRTRELAAEEKGPSGEVVKSGEKEAIEKALKERFGEFSVRDFYSVSPIVASEIERNAARAVLVAAIGILLYITWAFRKVPKPLRYGTCAVIALVHDTLVVLGIFSLLGRFANVEIDAMFIAGVLTVVGYSVHDTIVVFDRIRENMLKAKIKDFPTVVNHSIMETMSRSLNTTLTTLLVIVALFLFGGVTIRYFILVLLIGIITGTYSSIFNASQLLVVWENKEWGKFISWIPGLGSLSHARAK
jgi:preprotein translocase subunit SecF